MGYILLFLVGMLVGYVIRGMKSTKTVLKESKGTGSSTKIKKEDHVIK